MSRQRPLSDVGIKPFFNFMLLVWRICGIWPLYYEETRGWKVRLHTLWRLVSFMASFTYVFSISIQVVIDRNNPKEISDGISVLFITIIIYAKWMTLLVKEEEIKGIMSSLDDNFLELVERSEKEKVDSIKKAVRRAKLVTACYGGYFCFVGSLYVVKAYLERSQIAKGGTEGEVGYVNATGPNMIIKAYYPFDTEDPVLDGIVFLHQSIGVVTNGTICGFIDTFYFALMIQLCTHFEILNMTLSQVSETAVHGKGEVVASIKQKSIVDEDVKNLTNSSSLHPLVSGGEGMGLVRTGSPPGPVTLEEPVRECTPSLLECIRYHQYLLDYSEKLRVIMNPSLFLQYLIISICICFAGFQLVQEPLFSPDFVAIVGYVGALITQLGLLCYFANEITIESGKVSDAVYANQWYDHSPMFKFRVQNMMRRAQTPVTITAGNFGPLSLQMFTGVCSFQDLRLCSFQDLRLLENSYSYLAVLRQLQEDE
uniref:Odorant receptor n=1 Tax=Timema cristinae TaxID=61476 RepID=A0A7R9DGZ9_TIMCR|nr:unnamed protein product [Timema cristinae]